MSNSVAVSAPNSTPGSKELPLVVEAGKTTRFYYRAWRTGPIFFKIRLKSGKLSQLIEFSSPGHWRHEEISAVCSHCGEKAKATLLFF